MVQDLCHGKMMRIRKNLKSLRMHHTHCITWVNFRMKAGRELLLSGRVEEVHMEARLQENLQSDWQRQKWM